MAQEGAEEDMLTISGSFEDLYDDEESGETSKTAGVIAEWEEVNRRLRHHGYQPVMVLPSSRLSHIPGGAVVLEEYTTKNLRQTLERLINDCDRRQSLVQELISSSNRIQRDVSEERDRVYRYEMQMRDLQRELEEEKVRNQEMEGRRLAELQRHGEEVQDLKYNKTELLTLYTQLEQKCAQREAEINRLQLRCQDLVKKEERRLERQNKMFRQFRKRSPHRENALDQKVIDVIDSYEAQLNDMQEELEHLQRESSNQNSSYVGSYADGESESGASEDPGSPVVSKADSSSTVETYRKRDVVSPGSLKGSGGKWQGGVRRITDTKKAEQHVNEKLLFTEKQLKDAKKLIKLLESENTHLKMEIESRPNRDEWKRTRKYNKQLEKLLAQNNLSPPRKKHRDEQHEEDVDVVMRPRRYTTHVEDIDFLPIDACRDYLKDVCSGLQLDDLRDVQNKIRSVNVVMEAHPAMEKLVGDIVHLLNSEEAPKLPADVLSHSAVTHELHCERAWQNVIPALRLWLSELSRLKDLQASINQLSFRLSPWKPEAMFEPEDRRPVTVQKLKEALDSLCQDERAGPAEIRGGEEPSTEQLKSIIAHFQKLFDVNSTSGIFPRMNEIYMRLGETYNAMNTMRDLLGLEPMSKAADIVNAVGKLGKAKHLLKIEDLPGIIKRLDQYDEFFPAFHSMVTELRRLLGVQEMDEIVTAVTALVKFPHY